MMTHPGIIKPTSRGLLPARDAAPFQYLEAGFARLDRAIHWSATHDLPAVEAHPEGEQSGLDCEHPRQVDHFRV